MSRFRQTSEILRLMAQKERIRNIGIIAHIDHGKTTMTDSLLFEAGLLPARMAGSARALDYLEEEQKRGITIKTANVSLLHRVGDSTYLINVVDTPGHVDFTGKVTRALRAIDGVVVVVDSVEEIMAQTETVTRQALEERVRPVLFINKVDRLIKEIGLSSDEIQNKFIRIINDFNNLIELYAEPEFKDRWKVNSESETVVFGSALHKWGFTLRIINEKGKKFSDIADAYKKDKRQTLSKLLPLHSAILDLAVSNIPSPIQAQKYRVPKIWRGSLNSEIGQSMLNCNEKGPTVICLTAVQTVPDGDLVATGRLFSGSVKQGDQVYLVGADAECRVEQVSIYMSAFREAAHEISAGNIAALTGLSGATVGETVVEAKSKDAMIPFEPIKYVSEPVITVAVEPKNSSDLPKLIEAGNRLSIEDPNITVSINEDTGQYLLSGVGELHLEIGAKFLAQYGGGIELTASTPIVAYRESVSAQGRLVMTKSPNKQNKFWVQAQPLSNEVLNLIERGELGENTKQVQVEAILQEEADYRLEKARRVWALENHRNILIDSTKDSQDLSEVKNSVISGFHWACKTGPLCGEPLRGIEVKLIDASLHKDPKQREPPQVSRAISRAILGSCLSAKPSLLEPIYKIEITTATQLFGACTGIITHRRGRIQHAEKKGILTAIIGCIPVAETFGLSAEMRSATSGRAFWQLTFDHWEKAPKNIAAQLIKQVRERRGLPAEIPKPEKFIDEQDC